MRKKKKTDFQILLVSLTAGGDEWHQAIVAGTSLRLHKIQTSARGSSSKRNDQTIFWYWLWFALHNVGRVWVTSWRAQRFYKKRFTESPREKTSSVAPSLTTQYQTFQSRRLVSDFNFQIFNLIAHTHTHTHFIYIRMLRRGTTAAAKRHPRTNLHHTSGSKSETLFPKIYGRLNPLRARNVSTTPGYKWTVHDN